MRLLKIFSFAILLLVVLLVGCGELSEVYPKQEKEVILGIERDFEAISTLIEETSGIIIASIERIEHTGPNQLHRARTASLTVVGEDEARYRATILLDDHVSLWEIYDAETREAYYIAYASSVEVLREATGFDDFALRRLMRDLTFSGGIAEVAYAKFQEAEIMGEISRLEVRDNDGNAYRVFHSIHGSVNALLDLESGEYVFAFVCGLGYELEREARIVRTKHFMLIGVAAALFVSAAVKLFLFRRASKSRID